MPVDALVLLTMTTLDSRFYCCDEDPLGASAEWMLCNKWYARSQKEMYGHGMICLPADLKKGNIIFVLLFDFLVAILSIKGWGHLRTPKELLQGFITCKERGTLFTRVIEFNVPILIGRGCKLETFRTAKRTPYFGKRFTAARKKTKWPYFYSPVNLGVLKIERPDITLNKKGHASETNIN